MIKTHKIKVPAEIGVMSLVGILKKDYPLSYGNYFTMKLEKEYQIPNLNESMSKYGTEYGFHVCNFNCENFREARTRFLLDNEVEITIFQVDEKYPFIAITDERIPENWYCLWDEDMGYCNGQTHGENYQEVARTLGKRFGGDENYIFQEPKRDPRIITVEYVNNGEKDE
jgi:hypothetical protein